MVTYRPWMRLGFVTACVALAIVNVHLNGGPW